MKMPVILVAILIATFASAVDTRTDLCRVERQVFAKTACLELIFDQKVQRMAQDISGLLSRLQAATVAELISLQRQYETAQTRWQQELSQACRLRHEDDTVGFQICRIGSLDTRAEQLALSLERAAEDFGAPVEYVVPIPEAIEILIPLPVDVPFGGEARLPLLVPITQE